MRRALLVVVFGGLACIRSGRTLPPPKYEAIIPVAPPSAAEHTPAELAPWMRALFDPGPLRTYAWTHAVDTHDEGGSILETGGTLRCRSSAPTGHALDDGGLAWVSCQSCELEPGRDAFDSIEPDFDDCYLATAAGLWVLEAPPSDAAEARRIVAEPPYLPARPEPRSESATVDDEGFEHEESLLVAEQEIAVKDRHAIAWCRTDASTQTYGSRTTRCFAPGFGLVLLEMTGREGPSIEGYPLVDIDPPPEG